MNKSKLVLMLFLASFYSILGQITVENAESLDLKVRHQALHVIISDTSLKKYYLSALKQNQIFDTIIFIKEKKISEKIEPGKVYLSSMKFILHLTSSGGIRLINYLILFIPSEKSIQRLKTQNAIKITDLKEYAYFPLEPKNIDGIKRYNFAVLRNNIQQLENAINLKTDCKFYKDFIDNKAISNLKEDTLFIVSDRITDTTANLFKANYPYKYAFITSKVLESKVENVIKPFYYMHFSFSDEYYENQISIVNALTGEEIFHDKIMNYEKEISDKKLFFLIDKINGL